MFKHSNYIFIFFAFFLTACSQDSNTHSHSHDVIGDHPATETDHKHGSHGQTVSYLLFSNKYELFVEFPVLIVGHKSEFAAHVTDLSSYKPLQEGGLTVSIIKGDKGLRHQVRNPSTAGIFTPALLPKDPGKYEMRFDLSLDTSVVSFKIDEIEVFEDNDQSELVVPKSLNGDEVAFSKEQAWETDFETRIVEVKPFYSVIRTSGVVKPGMRSKFAANARIDGTVNLFKSYGETVRKGELLAVIKDSRIEDNISTRLAESKIAFDKSKAEYVRSKSMLEKQLISRSTFLELEANYKKDSLIFKQLSGNISNKGISLYAKHNGIISSVHVDDGEYVQNGKTVFTITKKDRFIIEVLVNQSDYSMVNSIFDANFKINGVDELISLSELSGEIISTNPFITEGTTRIPVRFSVRNTKQIIQGMYVEAFLKARKKAEAIIVPVSAIIEEQGLYYAYVQSGGESFIKRSLELGHSDGNFFEVIAGLEPGERIVTKGAYQIKLAAMSGDLPLHGHTH